MAKTINEEAHVHASVDGKKVIITEASIRRDLQLADEEGVDCLPTSTIFEQLVLMGFVQVFLEKQLDGMSNHKRKYISTSHTKKIFGNIRRVGKCFSGRITPLFPTMVEQSQLGEGGEEVFIEQKVVDDKEEINEVTLAQSLAELKTSKPKAKGIVLQEPSESTTTTTKTISSKQISQDMGKGIMVEEPVNPKKKKQIRLDEEAAKRIELVQGQGKEKGAGEKLIHDSSKKQKVDDDNKITKLKKVMEIILNEEEVVIDGIRLAVKSPKIVDWKIYKEGKKSYYQIVRADEKTQMYMVFSKMLKSFNREDLEDLYKIVLQEPCESTTTTTKITSSKQKSQDKGKGIMVEEPVNPKKKKQIRLDKEAAKRVNIFKDLRTELVKGQEKEKRAGEELIHESSKKQKVDDNKDIEELKKLMEIIPNEEEIAIDAIPLAVKTPKIVDWKI
nr:hypothetical protein [Tanacetum cinerariifolium]